MKKGSKAPDPISSLPSNEHIFYGKEILWNFRIRFKNLVNDSDDEINLSPIETSKTKAKCDGKLHLLIPFTFHTQNICNTLKQFLIEDPLTVFSSSNLVRETSQFDAEV
ncbi:CLUMA_CG013716, isoform A [Clunio marinus]|uniref:CLUMA_CG013716, isoform A n=1 Tax=Clunio marinus TaxID=568069 RepID=A0A1J1IJN2_9DIPT|nr:CLUMA_CG013716, isoform A [Clunio marinus]